MNTATYLDILEVPVSIMAEMPIAYHVQNICQKTEITTDTYDTIG